MTSMVPDVAAFRCEMLKIAKGFVGVSRANDPAQVARFLAVQGLPYAQDGNPLAYCMSGVSFAACKAYAGLAGMTYTPETAVEVFRDTVRPLVDLHFFKTTASCWECIQDAQARGKWLGVDSIGDDFSIPPDSLIFFQFGPNDRHVEIVEADGGDEIDTIGFNTCANHESGVVAIKQRNWTNVLGFVLLK